MTGVRVGLDLLFGALGAVAWALAVLVVVGRVLSPAAGGLLALALLISLLGMLLSGHVQESRWRRLAAGACPRCRASVRSEHRHRRLGSGGEWLSPETSWECGACGFSQSEAWPCPGCPVPP
ncbi:MAG TPA: hypothetical protein VII57_05050 [Dehalococcoidia bacterium]